MTILLQTGPERIARSIPLVVPFNREAFLSALNYHRWHSPVSWKIIKAFFKVGTYYLKCDSEGEAPDGPTDSQGYLTHVATRATIFIDCGDPVIG